MGVLLRALPADARLARLPGDEATWTTVHELLAVIAEEVSVLAADRRRKRPVQIPRPATVRRAREQRRPATRGVRGLVRMATTAGRLRTGP